jgi:hypothetical protein
MHITLAVRLIRYSTVWRRQCLQIDKAAVDQNVEVLEHLRPQFLDGGIIPDSHRVVRVASELHGRQPGVPIRRNFLCKRHRIPKRRINDLLPEHVPLRRHCPHIEVPHAFFHHMQAIEKFLLVTQKAARCVGDKGVCLCGFAAD